MALSLFVICVQVETRVTTTFESNESVGGKSQQISLSLSFYELFDLIIIPFNRRAHTKTKTPRRSLRKRMFYLGNVSSLPYALYVHTERKKSFFPSARATTGTSGIYKSLTPQRRVK